MRDPCEPFINVTIQHNSSEPFCISAYNGRISLNASYAKILLRELKQAVDDFESSEALYTKIKETTNISFHASEPSYIRLDGCRIEFNPSQAILLCEKIKQSFERIEKDKAQKYGAT